MRQLTPLSLKQASHAFSELPMRQLTWFLHVPVIFSISELPMRQLTRGDGF